MSPPEKGRRDMPSLHGTNLTNVKEKNRALALRLISTGQSVSRANLARSMHLTKTTLGNIVSDLIANDIIKEYTGLFPWQEAYYP